MVWQQRCIDTRCRLDAHGVEGRSAPGAELTEIGPRLVVVVVVGVVGVVAFVICGLVRD